MYLHEISPEASERALLGAILINPDCFPLVREMLPTADMLKVEMHQNIYLAYDRCYRKSGTIDIVEAFEDIQGVLGAGNPVGAYMAGLVNATPTSANVEIYTRIVLENHIRREVVREAGTLAKKARDNQAGMEEIQAIAAGIAEKTLDRLERERIESTEDLAIEAVERLHNLSDAGGIVGLPTGIAGYDKITGGLTPDMHVIAARPSVGKTALALNIARNVAVKGGHKVLILSLEMSKQDLIERFIMLEGGIEKARLSGGFMSRAEKEKINPAAARIAMAPIELVKFGVMSPSKLKRSMQLHPDCKLVIIDYLQLMTIEGWKSNREQEVATISRSIKNLTGEFNVPIIALSQIKREGADQIPRLSDLRESGAIEQDADTVLFLHPEKGSDLLTAALAKGRKCGTGLFQIHFSKSTQRMDDVGKPTNEPSPPAEEYYDESDDTF